MKAFIKLSAFGVLVASALALAGEQPEFITKEVTGEAAIVKGDKIKAKEDAKQQALREAVAQVAGVLVTGDTLTRNNQLVSDTIFAKSEGYIHKYDITSEKEEAGVMKVSVKAEVGTKALDQDLALVQQMVTEMGNRSMGIVVQEQTVAPDGTFTNKGTMAAALTDAFKKDGWKVVQIGSKDQQTKVSAAAGHGKVDDKDIDMTAADFILTGTVGFKQIGATDQRGGLEPGKNFFPVEGSYEMQVFVGGNAAHDTSREVLSRVAGDFRFGSKDINVQNVNAIISYDRTAADVAKVRSSAIVGQVRAGLYEYLRNARQNGRPVVMSVNGLQDFKAFTAFKKSLEGVNGIKKVNPGTLSGGKAKFDVVFVGTTEELAEKMSSVTWNKRAVSVTGADATSMELQLK
ncbi:MAG: flagellar assembly protein T N-terminal domain-containing protein [Myxococcaceae bacterium]